MTKFTKHELEIQKKYLKDIPEISMTYNMNRIGYQEVSLSAFTNKIFIRDNTKEINVANRKSKVNNYIQLTKDKKSGNGLGVLQLGFVTENGLVPKTDGYNYLHAIDDENVLEKLDNFNQTLLPLVRTKLTGVELGNSHLHQMGISITFPYSNKTFNNYVLGSNFNNNMPFNNVAWVNVNDDKCNAVGCGYILFKEPISLHTGESKKLQLLYTLEDAFKKKILSVYNTPKMDENYSKYFNIQGDYPAAEMENTDIRFFVNSKPLYSIKQINNWVGEPLSNEEIEFLINKNVDVTVNGSMDLSDENIQLTYLSGYKRSNIDKLLNFAKSNEFAENVQNAKDIYSQIRVTLNALWIFLSTIGVNDFSRELAGLNPEISLRQEEKETYLYELADIIKSHYEKYYDDNTKFINEMACLLTIKQNKVPNYHADALFRHDQKHRVNNNLFATRTSRNLLRETVNENRERRLCLEALMNPYPQNHLEEMTDLQRIAISLYAKSSEMRIGYFSRLNSVKLKSVIKEVLKESGLLDSNNNIKSNQRAWLSQGAIINELVKLHKKNKGAYPLPWFLKNETSIISKVLRMLEIHDKSVSEKTISNELGLGVSQNEIISKCLDVYNNLIIEVAKIANSPVAKSELNKLIKTLFHSDYKSFMKKYFYSELYINNKFEQQVQAYTDGIISSNNNLSMYKLDNIITSIISEKSFSELSEEDMNFIKLVYLSKYMGQSLELAMIEYVIVDENRDMNHLTDNDLNYLVDTINERNEKYFSKAGVKYVCQRVLFNVNLSEKYGEYKTLADTNLVDFKDNHYDEYIETKERVKQILKKTMGIFLYLNPIGFGYNNTIAYMPRITNDLLFDFYYQMPKLKNVLYTALDDYSYNATLDKLPLQVFNVVSPFSDKSRVKFSMLVCYIRAYCHVNRCSMMDLVYLWDNLNKVFAPGELIDYINNYNKSSISRYNMSEYNPIIETDNFLKEAFSLFTKTRNNETLSYKEEMNYNHLRYVLAEDFLFTLNKKDMIRFVNNENNNELNSISDNLVDSIESRYKDYLENLPEIKEFEDFEYYEKNYYKNFSYYNYYG